MDGSSGQEWVRSVVEQGFSGVLITDARLPDPVVVYVNPAFEAATGYALAEVVGRPLSELQRLSGVLQRVRAGLPPDQRFIEGLSPYQTTAGERLGEWRVGPVRSQSGEVTHWLVIFRDITERKRLEREILEITDRERQRVGQDLHDGVCQHLAAVELMSELLQQRLANRNKRAAATAGEIASHVRQIIAEARALARGLSPATLESEGLVSALQELAENSTRLFGVRCEFRGIDLETLPVHDTALATHLYRIAQEAVSNAVKHGKATLVEIRLEGSSGGLTLTIKDDGQGIPEESARNASGMGLHIMRYRAGIISAAFSVVRNPSGGTIVTCSLPALPEHRG